MDTGEFYRDTWVEIDLSCIEENIRSFRRLLPDTTEIMAVVKANGYGHGAVPVAKTALEAGATYLAVALLDEALSLRQQGIKAPILVLGRTRPEDAVLAAKYNIALTVFQASWAREASAHLQGGQPVALHLKVDTGMGRIGTRDKEETQELVLTIEKYPSLQLEGVFTHFATADELESPLVEQQFERFSESLAWLKELGAVPRYIHCGNSAASLRFPKQIFNIARIGISMYGLAPSGELKNVLPFPLKEAFTLNTRLVHVKKCSQEIRLATVPPIRPQRKSGSAPFQSDMPTAGKGATRIRAMRLRVESRFRSWAESAWINAWCACRLK